MKLALMFLLGTLCGGVIIFFAYPYISEVNKVNKEVSPINPSVRTSLITPEVTEELKRLDSCRSELDKRKDTLNYITEVFYQKSLNNVELTDDEKVVLHLRNKLVSISNNIYETGRILNNQAEDPNLVKEFNKYYRRVKQIKCPNFEGLEPTYSNLEPLCEILTKAENLIDDVPFEENYATKAEFMYDLNSYNRDKEQTLEECKSPSLDADRPL